MRRRRARGLPSRERARLVEADARRGVREAHVEGTCAVVRTPRARVCACSSSTAPPPRARTRRVARPLPPRARARGSCGSPWSTKGAPRDRLRRGLDVDVRVALREAEQLGQVARDGRLPAAGRGRPARRTGRVPGATGVSAAAARGSRRGNAGVPADLRDESPPNLLERRRARARPSPRRRPPAGGTAHTSERWCWALATSPVTTSTVASARGTVEIGFMAGAHAHHLAVRHAALDAAGAGRLRRWMRPSAPRSISSCAADPRRRAVRKPSPTSTPSIRLDPHQTAARRASRPGVAARRCPGRRGPRVAARRRRRGCRPPSGTR